MPRMTPAQYQEYQARMFPRTQTHIQAGAPVCKLCGGTGVVAVGQPCICTYGERKPKPVEREAKPKNTDEASLNKTEAAFLAHLLELKQWNDPLIEWIGVMNVTLKLAHDCRYTPDFATQGCGKFQFWEVKGFWRDDARVKIKVAARLFPWATFIAVKKTKSGWEKEIIKP